MKMLVILVCLIPASVACAAAPAEDNTHKWMDDYGHFTKSIRVLEPSGRKECERLLAEILKGLDDNCRCREDRDCALLDQDPFGGTVPVRVDAAKDIDGKMKAFRDSCDNGSSHGVRDPGLENTPVCHEHRCMVRTRFKR